MEGAAEGFAAEEQCALVSWLWNWDGTLERLHHALYVAVREQEGREASPTAAIIDSQSAKGRQKGALLDPQGGACPRAGPWPDPGDAGKKLVGRKRHIFVDTLGLLLSVAVHSADIQDRDGAALVLTKRARAMWPFLERIFADAGYQGTRVALAATSSGDWVIEVVRRNELHKFVVLPKRWIVERANAWIIINHRLMRDYERYTRTVAAFIRLAMIKIMLRRLAKPKTC